MPTYEYRCDACGHQFEEVQKISEPAIERCPKCKKKKARRQISQGNFILKGGGWYVTDYKSGGGKKAAKDKDREASGSGATDKKSDDKTSADKTSDDKTSADKTSDDKKSDAKDDKGAKKAAKD